MFSLKNKVVLITGGYGYLGRGISEALSDNGAKVYVLGKDEGKFNEAFESSNSIYFRRIDVSTTSSIKSCFKEISDETGRVDVLINNAFYISGQDPENMTDEEWFMGIDGTLSSTFRCIREIIPYFKKQSSGKIINVSSIYGIASPDFTIYEQFPQFLNPPHYGAAKAGIIQLTKYYAAYLSRYKINVNCVSPGPFPSEKVSEYKSFVKQLSKSVPLQRVGQPDDLKGIFVLLSSDSSDFITGQNVVVDGGWTIW
ncbi:MAG: SDR family oxidoreductase [Bacteroidota bacterium]